MEVLLQLPIDDIKIQDGMNILDFMEEISIYLSAGEQVEEIREVLAIMYRQETDVELRMAIKSIWDNLNSLSDASLFCLQYEGRRNPPHSNKQPIIY